VAPKEAGDVQESVREVMRSFPQGVTVVTAKAKGSLWGVTVSSFTVASLDPPLVLISVMKRQATSEALSAASGFTVNLLAEDQAYVSDRFAGKTALKDRFEGIRYRLDGTSSPVIEGAIGYIDCTKWREYDGGDHLLILGQVIKARKVSPKPPLVYYLRKYTGLVTPEAEESSVDLVL